MSTTDVTYGALEAVANSVRSLPNPDKRVFAMDNRSLSANELANEIIERTNFGIEFCTDFIEEELEDIEENPNYKLNSYLVKNLISKIEANGSLEAIMSFGEDAHSGYEVITELIAESQKGREFYASHLRKVLEILKE